MTQKDTTIPKIDLSLHLWKPITFEQYIDNISSYYLFEKHEIGVQVQDLGPSGEDKELANRTAVIHYITGPSSDEDSIFPLGPQLCLLTTDYQFKPVRKHIAFETTMYVAGTEDDSTNPYVR